MIQNLSKIISVRSEFRCFLGDQQRGIHKLDTLARKYAWAAWGGANEVAELLALSRGNLLRTNDISLQLMSIMRSEVTHRIGMGKTSAYYDVSQTWATSQPSSGLKGALEDLERWKAPVEEGVRRACSVITTDPTRWARRVGLMNHVLLINHWLEQLDRDGGLDGAELAKMAALIREYHVGSVTAAVSHIREGVPSGGDLGFLAPLPVPRPSHRPEVQRGDA